MLFFKQGKRVTNGAALACFLGMLYQHHCLYTLFFFDAGCLILINQEPKCLGNFTKSSSPPCKL
jgi:hypothetical protein